MKSVLPVLSVREQYKRLNEWLVHRLDHILPSIMKRSGIDMWVVITDEYNEDPVTKTLLPPQNINAVGKMIFVFYLQPNGNVIREVIARPSGIENIYRNSWYGITDLDWKGKKLTPPSNTQFEHLNVLIKKYQPNKIGINMDELHPYCDGLSHSNFLLLNEHLDSLFLQKLTPARALLIGWMETRSEEEIVAYDEIVSLAHSIIRETFTKEMITPGVTTNDDLRFSMMQKAIDLGLTFWFDCSVGIFREGRPGLYNSTDTILYGDVVHCDFGITYLGLCTDTQELCYILKPSETDAPAGIHHAMSVTNRLQDILLSHLQLGNSGNGALIKTLEQAKLENIDAQIYSHPLGVYGHGPGPMIGSFSNQAPSPRGDYPIYDNTAYSIELNAKVEIPEWNNQILMCCLETDAVIEKGQVRYLSDRQQKIHIV